MAPYIGMVYFLCDNSVRGKRCDSRKTQQMTPINPFPILFNGFCEADNQIRNKQWRFQINSFLISGPSHHNYISESENEWFCQSVFFVIVRYSNKSLFFLNWHTFPQTSTLVHLTDTCI